jgi:hypothetical protein
MPSTHPIRTCASGGLLIQLRGLLPPTPSEFAPAFIGSFIGCNNLTCLDCNQAVHHLEDWYVKEPKHFDGKTLRTATDPGALPWLALIKSSSPRTYYCDCGFWEARSPISLHPVDPHIVDEGFDFKWRCAGHRLPSNDDRLGGLALGPLLEDQATFRQLALGQLQMDDSPRPSGHPGIDLRRLYTTTVGTPDAPVIALRVAALLRDPDPVARMNALAFYFYFPTVEGAELLLAAAKERATLFDEVPHPVYPQRMLSRLLDDALERRATHVKDLALIAYLRERLLAGKTTDDLLWAVATFDWEWVESHAVRILMADPRQLGPLLMSTQNFPAERITTVLQRIVAAGVVTEAEIQTVCREVWEAMDTKLAAIGRALGWTF